MQTCIPIPYQVILKRMIDESYENKIGTGRAKYLLTWFFRMGTANPKRIFDEMKKCGWIEFENHKNIRLLVNREDVE